MRKTIKDAEFFRGDKVKVNFRYTTVKIEGAPKGRRIAKVLDVRCHCAINAITYVVQLKNGEKFEVLEKGIKKYQEKASRKKPVMKIRKLSEVLKTYPDFKPGWQWKDGELANPKYGSVKHVVVCKDDGTPIYDTYQIGETAGAIVVPYYWKNNVLYLGFIDELRPMVKDGKGNQGKVVLRGVPRGFKDPGETLEEAAIRELGEETSAVVKKLTFIGRQNPNSTFYTTCGIPVFKAEVDPEKISQLRPDVEEKIVKSNYYPLKKALKKIQKDASAKKTECGLSLAALFLFLISEGLI